MTTLAPAHLPRTREAGEHRVPWQSIARVNWLQNRGTLLSLALLGVAFAAAIVIGESTIQSPYASYVAHGCSAHPAQVACVTTAFANNQTFFSNLVIALRVMPVAIGVFVGAPLFARELESGAFRFTWTQSVGRTRHIALSLAVLALPVAAMTAVLGLLLNWYAHPFEVVGIESQWESGLFEAGPLVAAAWSVFALSLGALLGMAIRRTVAAMAATAVLVGGLAVASYVEFVHHLLAIAPIATTRLAPDGAATGLLSIPAYRNIGPPGAWYVAGWFTGPHGQTLSENASLHLEGRFYGCWTTKRTNGEVGCVMHWLSSHGYTYWLSYQPTGRFWDFQAVEVVVLVVLAIAFALSTLRLARSGRP